MSRTLTMFVVVMALTLGMMACEKKAPAEKAPDSTQPAGITVDSAKPLSAALSDATKSADGLLAQSKDAAVKAAQTAVDTLEKKWQDLVAKAAPTTPEAKTDLQKSMTDMTATLTDIRTKLTEAKDASAEAWQKDIKPALDAALKNAQRLYDDTAAKFAGK